MEIKTSSGFICDVSTENLDDMRLLDALIDMETPGISDFYKVKATKDVILALLGEEQKELLYQHIEKTHGKAKAGVVAQELQEIIQGLGEDKKK